MFNAFKLIVARTDQLANIVNLPRKTHNVSHLLVHQIFLGCLNTADTICKLGSNGNGRVTVLSHAFVRV